MTSLNLTRSLLRRCLTIAQCPTRTISFFRRKKQVPLANGTLSGKKSLTKLEVPVTISRSVELPITIEGTISKVTFAPKKLMEVLPKSATPSLEAARRKWFWKKKAISPPTSKTSNKSPPIPIPVVNLPSSTKAKSPSWFTKIFDPASIEYDSPLAVKSPPRSPTKKASEIKTNITKKDAGDISWLRKSKSATSSSWLGRPRAKISEAWIGRATSSTSSYPWSKQAQLVPTTVMWQSSRDSKRLSLSELMELLGFLKAKRSGALGYRSKSNNWLSNSGLWKKRRSEIMSDWNLFATKRTAAEIIGLESSRKSWLDRMFPRKRKKWF